MNKLRRKEVLYMFPIRSIWMVGVCVVDFFKNNQRRRQGMRQRLCTQLCASQKFHSFHYFNVFITPIHSRYE